jgi:hypothetical protein
MAYRTAATKRLPEYQDGGLMPLLLKVRTKQMADDGLTNRLMEAFSTTETPAH